MNFGQEEKLFFDKLSSEKLLAESKFVVHPCSVVESAFLTDLVVVSSDEDGVTEKSGIAD